MDMDVKFHGKQLDTKQLGMALVAFLEANPLKNTCRYRD